MYFVALKWGKRFDYLYLPLWDLALERLDRFRRRR
jgi:hypothetical protein